nr:hypothetical protein [Tanacetum cinerariifolium]
MASSSDPHIDYAPMVHHSSEYSSPETGLVVLVFQKGDNPIDAINHMMSFLTAVVTSRYPATNNQLRTSSNPRQQATINNGRVTIQPIQERHNFMSAGSSRPIASRSGRASGKQRVKDYQKRTKSNQNWTKREAWRSQEKFKAVTVDKGRKTEENAKRMVENAYTVKKLLKFKEGKKRQGPNLQIDQSSSRGAISVTVSKLYH